MKPSLHQLNHVVRFISAGSMQLGGSRCPYRRQSHGFTLVEVLIGMSLSMIVMAAVLSSYIYLGRSLGRLANQQILETQGRHALAYFAQDVRMTSAIPTTPTNYDLGLTVVTSSGTETITYYYNSSNSPGPPVTISGSTISPPANSLIRVVAQNGSIVSNLTLLSNVIPSVGCYFRFYDGSSNPFDSGASPYTTSINYSLSSIKQVSLNFNLQTGMSFNGTQTAVYRVASPRLILRNSSLLQ